MLLAFPNLSGILSTANVAIQFPDNVFVFVVLYWLAHPLNIFFIFALNFEGVVVLGQFYKSHRQLGRIWHILWLYELLDLMNRGKLRIDFLTPFDFTLLCFRTLESVDLAAIQPSNDACQSEEEDDCLTPSSKDDA